MREENFDVYFIVLRHPELPLSTARELRVYARQVLGIPAENIKFSRQTTWESYELII